jgi:N4-(beta-N-acetylglucosaminyl)-L-asparaginase
VYYDSRGVAYTNGTINMNAVTATGDIASVTTTSGLSWKIPGRVGDSPIIGAGQYCDNDVGAAGSTGRGEANIKVCGAFLAVEFMRQGMSPEQALIKVMERVIAMTEKRLLNDKGRPYFDLNYYAVNKKGEYAGACAYQGSSFAVCDAKGARREDAVFLFKKEERPANQPISGTMIKP